MGTKLMLCGCKRVWYCNETCKIADATTHASSGFHMDLERIPRDIMRKHILPLCLLPRDQSERGEIEILVLRCHGLRLRLINKAWRGRVNDCKEFWLHVVPCDWLKRFKPDPDISGKLPVRELTPHVLVWGRRNGEAKLKRKKKDAEKRVEKHSKAVAKLQKELEQEESCKKSSGAELQEITSRLKRLKGDAP